MSTKATTTTSTPYEIGSIYFTTNELLPIKHLSNINMWVVKQLKLFLIFRARNRCVVNCAVRKEKYMLHRCTSLPGSAFLIKLN